MGFMVDNIGLGHVFLRVIRVFLVSNIQTISYTDIYLYVAFTGRTNGKTWETPTTQPKQTMFFSEIGEH